jgi:hypothetical protein
MSINLGSMQRRAAEYPRTSGMTRPNKAQGEHEPSAAEMQADSSEMVESQPTPRLSADVWQGGQATGDLASFGAMSTRPVRPVPGAGGEPGNNSQLPSNYPTASSSRAPLAGAMPAKKSLARVKRK